MPVRMLTEPIALAVTGFLGKIRNVKMAEI
jgi:hypothetical protein